MSLVSFARYALAAIGVAVGAAALSSACGGATGTVSGDASFGGSAFCPGAGSHCASDVDCCSGRAMHPDEESASPGRRSALRGRRGGVRYVPRLLLALCAGGSAPRRGAPPRARVRHRRRLLQRGLRRGACKPLNTACKTSGDACTGNAECCSQLCTSGRCSIASSFCIQNGDTCTQGPDCCGGVCAVAAGQSSCGTCGAPPRAPASCRRGRGRARCAERAAIAAAGSARRTRHRW